MKSVDSMKIAKVDVKSLSREELEARAVDLEKRLAKIKKLASAQLAEEEIGDVKYVMREFDEILVLAGGKRTDAW